MKILYLLCLGLGSSAFAQTITFNGCHNLFDDQDFIFNSSTTDAHGKKIYVTSPIDGNQDCSGLGTCEFKIQWNNTETRWEFLADSGNGDLEEPFLIYYNSTGNNSASNPPSNSVGTWEENSLETEDACGGALTSSNSNMTGDVHTTTLAVNDLSKGKIQIFPNPVTDFINVSGIENAQNFIISNVAGQEVVRAEFKDQLNVSKLSKGIYFLRINDSKGQSYHLKFIKK